MTQEVSFLNVCRVDVQLEETEDNSDCVHVCHMLFENSDQASSELLLQSRGLSQVVILQKFFTFVCEVG